MATRPLAFIGRWSLRFLLASALLNLGWDLWGWHDRARAEGERRFYRGAEQPGDVDYGLAEISIVNETDRDFLIESFVLDGWGGPYTHEPTAQRTLARAGQSGSVRQEERHLDHLVGTGRLVLRRSQDDPTRVVAFEVDRRRPNSCRIEVRVGEESETVSGCQPLNRTRLSFRWLFGPPNY